MHLPAKAEEASNQYHETSTKKEMLKVIFKIQHVYNERYALELELTKDG